MPTNKYSRTIPDEYRPVIAQAILNLAATSSSGLWTEAQIAMLAPQNAEYANAQYDRWIAQQTADERGITHTEYQVTRPTTGEIREGGTTPESAEEVRATWQRNWGLEDDALVLATREVTQWTVQS